MIGKCLCGEVLFEIKGKLPNLYQCHCSLCRKATGSSANAATLINKNNLVWISGRDGVKSYEEAAGFRSNFCKQCGCPVPNVVKGADVYWIPAGLLDDDSGIKVVAHILTGSKAEWDTISDDVVQYKGMPAVEELMGVLNQS